MFIGYLKNQTQLNLNKICYAILKPILVIFMRNNILMLDILFLNTHNLTNSNLNIGTFLIAYK